MSKMINLYKLTEQGVLRKSDGANIPAADGNRDWKEYQKWLAEGNTPDPIMTPEEETQKLIDDEVDELRNDLRRVVTGQFEMMLELFKLLKQFTECTNTDVDPAILTKAQLWTQKLARLKEIS